MSDPIAVSLLSKLVSWYPFESNMNDALGVNNLTVAVTAGHAAGKVGNCLVSGARAKATLASALPMTTSTGTFSIGGWWKFAAISPSVASFGLCGNPAIAENERFYISNDGTTVGFKVFGWTAAAGVPWAVIDPVERLSMAYPITVQAQDANGTTATSDQVISIAAAEGTVIPGWYFVTATWNQGTAKVYVNGSLEVTGAPASLRTNSATTVQVANAFGPTTSSAGLDECFIANAVLTDAEVAWLYNAGAGRTYTDIVAAAA